MANPPTPREIATEKLTRVFGEVRGQQLLERAMARARVDAIETADDLLKVARALEVGGGFEGAVGAMLGVSAVMLGAKSSR